MFTNIHSKLLFNIPSEDYLLKKKKRILKSTLLIQIQYIKYPKQLMNDTRTSGTQKEKKTYKSRFNDSGLLCVPFNYRPYQGAIKVGGLTALSLVSIWYVLDYAED